MGVPKARLLAWCGVVVTDKRMQPGDLMSATASVRMCAIAKLIQEVDRMVRDSGQATDFLRRHLDWPLAARTLSRIGHRTG